MAKSTNTEVVIQQLQVAEIRVVVVGTTPLIMNRQAAKAKRELLLPAVKNRAAQRATLKHDPLEEFRDSLYRTDAEDSPTRLVFPSPAFKAAMATAALEIPGATKSSIGRLLYVQGYSVPIYGVPTLFMAGVRQAGMNHTPDIRTRGLIPEWACVLSLKFPRPNLNEVSVANLLAAAGMICGVGDFRQEKGKGNYGLFRLATEDDPDFLRIVSSGGKEAQDAAIETPDPFDAESEELWTWFEEEVRRTGRKEVNGEQQRVA